MIVGDEHIAVISAEGRLPAELDREALFIVPAAYERLRLVAMRETRGALPIRGQISGRLSRLDRAVRNAVVEGAPEVARNESMSLVGTLLSAA